MVAMLDEAKNNMLFDILKAIFSRTGRGLIERDDHAINLL